MRAKKTVEILSEPHRVCDLWDEMYSEANVHKLILNYFPNSRFCVRLLGPFVGAERIYVPKITDPKIASFITPSIQIKLMRRDSESYQRVVEEINQYSKEVAPYQPRKRRRTGGLFNPNEDRNSDPSKELTDVGSFIEKLYGNAKWQKVVLVNGFIKEESVSFGAASGIKIKIVPLFTTMVNSIFERSHFRTSDVNDIRISGLCAYDLIITKEGAGMQSRVTGSLSESSTHLSKDHLDYIMGKGLLDIPSVVNEVNMRHQGPYYYRLNGSYKMSSELCGHLQDEFHCRQKYVEENNHMKAIDEKINQLPLEAFENSESSLDAIGSLEI